MADGAARRRSFRDRPTPAKWMGFAVRLAATGREGTESGQPRPATGVKDSVRAALDTSGIPEKGRLSFRHAEIFLLIYLQMLENRVQSLLHSVAIVKKRMNVDATPTLGYRLFR